MNLDPARRVFRRPLALLMAATVLATLAGCGTTTRLTDLWRDPAYSGPAPKNLLVIGMSNDPERRRMWEDTFLASLKRQGIHATASYTLFPGALPDTESVKQKVRDNGYDAVIVTHRLARGQVDRFVPPGASTAPDATASQWGYYHTYYQEVSGSGYVESDQLMRFQTDLWVVDGKRGRQVWMGRSETMSPDSAKELSRELTDQIIPELMKQGLL